ncbi:type II toxin-antitoxin system Phd/YefM family antitoxin [Thermosipho atlanticus]|uniref:Antitoxin n=1 Tax=Thermosipho atlanticus DSM 15807 TaxID=1123380 RepID=A0A1M5QT74_9BACT|nr:prevent-host-death family protein [Thermosipho atlanticus DSM 15807]
MPNQKHLFYSLAEAKAKFSKVIEDSIRNDVIITKNGHPTSVILNYEKYLKIINFIDKVWDLYLLEIGDPSLFGKLNINDLFEDINED